MSFLAPLVAQAGSILLPKALNWLGKKLTSNRGFVGRTARTINSYPAARNFISNATNQIQTNINRMA